MHDSDEGTGAGMELPRYVSHKKVWALEIDAVGPQSGPGDPVRLAFRDKGYASMEAPSGMFLRYQPVAGDFYVVYADGYKSFSPRKAFLEGYTREGARKPDSVWLPEPCEEVETGDVMINR